MKNCTQGFINSDFFISTDSYDAQKLTDLGKL